MLDKSSDVKMIALDAAASFYGIDMMVLGGLVTVVLATLLLIREAMAGHERHRRGRRYLDAAIVPTCIAFIILLIYRMAAV